MERQGSSRRREIGTVPLRGRRERGNQTGDREGRNRTRKRPRPGSESQQTNRGTARPWRGGVHAQQFSRSQQAQNRPSHEASDQAGADPVIPGFYYDKEKKKYFKIEAGSAGPYSQDTVRQVEKEKKKAATTLKDQARRKTGKSNLMLNKRPTIASFLRQRELGTSIGASLQPRGHREERQVLHLLGQPIGSLEMGSRVTDVQTDTTFDHVAVGTQSSFRLFNVNQSADQLLTPSCDAVAMSQVSALRFAPRASTPVISVATLGGMNETASCKIISLDNEGLSVQACYQAYKGKAIWSLDWPTCSPNLLAYGGHGVCAVDVMAGRTVHSFRTGHSDVFALQLRRNEIYCGSRNGSILVCDMRANKPHQPIGLSGAVCDLHLLQDEWGLLVSCMNGSVGLYDMRVWKETIRYQGHSNDHTLLRMAVDPADDILFAGGQDGVVRAWPVQCGGWSMWSQHPAAGATTPAAAVAYSSQWAGVTQPMLLAGRGSRLDIIGRRRFNN